MSRIIIVVCLFVMLFVAVSPAFAGGPGGPGPRQGGGFGQKFGNYAQSSAQGWSYAIRNSGKVAKAVGQEAASLGRAAGQAVQQVNQATVNFGDTARIGAAIDNTTRRAQSR